MNKMFVRALSVTSRLNFRPDRRLHFHCKTNLLYLPKHLGRTGQTEFEQDIAQMLQGQPMFIEFYVFHQAQEFILRQQVLRGLDQC